MPPGDGGAALAIVVRTLEAAIDTHRWVREQDLTEVIRAASSIVEALGAGGQVLALATVEARGTRSIWSRNSWAVSRRSALDLPWWRSRLTRVC